MADFTTRGGTPVSGGVTGSRDVISSPSILRWLGEGKVFEAGFGPEDDEENVLQAAAIDETKPAFALIAPTGSATLVLPLFLRLSLTDDGGALSNWDVTFTRAAAECVTTLAITGGAELNFKRNMNREYASQGNASAVFADPLTSTALTNADYVGMIHGHAIDAALTTGIPTVAGTVNEVAYNFLDGSTGVPHILSKGAAMSVYAYTNTGDAKWRVYMQWAELTANDLY